MKIEKLMNKNKDKIILDLCGAKGNWSRNYSDNGYDVRILDIIYGIDIRLYKPNPYEKIYGIFAAPPCTHFAVSGARWFKQKGEQALFDALAILDSCCRIILISNPVFWCLENPVGRLVNYLGKPKMYFNPCDYGDPYTKKTCLWGKFNIPIKNPVEPIGKNPIHYMPPSEDRGILRSITPPGFAKAFFLSNQ